MKKFGYLFGAGMVYAIYLILDISGGAYLLTHIPETFDLGYAGLVFACLFLLISAITSVRLTYKHLNSYIDYLESTD